MNEERFALANDEHLLGQWAITYSPPAGGRCRGQLRITDRRVVFVADVGPRQFEGVVLGPIDSEAAACALDLDWPNVIYDGHHLTVSIPVSQIEYVTVENKLLGHSVNMTIKNNGSVHQFNRGLAAVTGVVRALEQAVRA